MLRRVLLAQCLGTTLVMLEMEAGTVQGKVCARPFRTSLLAQALGSQ